MLMHANLSTLGPPLLPVVGASLQGGGSADIPVVGAKGVSLEINVGDRSAGCTFGLPWGLAVTAGGGLGSSARAITRGDNALLGG
jgi:hypothetical protein